MTRFPTVFAVALATGCASTGAVGRAADACLPLASNRWPVPVGDSVRVVRVWLDERAQTRDGWSTYGRRRLAEAMQAWNRLRLPVRMILSTTDRDADVEVNVIDSLPAPQRQGAVNEAGITRLTFFEPGLIRKAHIFIAVESSFGARFRVPDQEATLLHELGHALGLPHATGPRSLMSEVRWGSTLTGNDIALARSHYRRPRCVARG